MPSDPLSLRVVRAVDYQNDARWSYPVNLYPHHTLYFVLEGDGHVSANNHVVDLKPGTCCLIPANTLFSCWCDSHIHKLYVELYLQTASGVDVFFDHLSMLVRPFPKERTKELLKALSEPGICGRMQFEGLLLCALSEMVVGSALPQHTDASRLTPVLEEMVRNVAADLHIGDLARRHGWEPSSFTRAFVKSSGCSPKRYLNHLLVNLLKRDLLFTDLTLNELAQRYHFCDSYYLSAFFKRYMGLSPQHYRKQRKIGAG